MACRLAALLRLTSPFVVGFEERQISGLGYAKVLPGPVLRVPRQDRQNSLRYRPAARQTAPAFLLSGCGLVDLGVVRRCITGSRGRKRLQPFKSLGTDLGRLRAKSFRTRPASSLQSATPTSAFSAPFLQSPSINGRPKT
jgi:hypothetical protein